MREQSEKITDKLTELKTALERGEIEMAMSLITKARENKSELDWWGPVRQSLNYWQKKGDANIVQKLMQILQEEGGELFAHGGSGHPSGPLWE